MQDGTGDMHRGNSSSKEEWENLAGRRLKWVQRSSWKEGRWESGMSSDWRRRRRTSWKTSILMRSRRSMVAWEEGKASKIPLLAQLSLSSITIDDERERTDEGRGEERRKQKKKRKRKWKRKKERKVKWRRRRRRRSVDLWWECTLLMMIDRYR